MKTFFIWLIIQCLFARMLLGMGLMTWERLHITPDYIGYFIIPATIVCAVETIVSGIVVYGILDRDYRDYRNNR